MAKLNKEFVINEEIVIAPNYNRIFDNKNDNLEDCIYVGSRLDGDDEFIGCFGIGIDGAKEMIKALQEIVDFYEGAESKNNPLSLKLSVNIDEDSIESVRKQLDELHEKISNLKVNLRA